MLKIRLRRVGTRSRPFYRLVVSDSRFKPDGRFVEAVGYYDPKTKPSTLQVDLEKVDHWLKKGADASVTVRKLVERARVSQG